MTRQTSIDCYNKIREYGLLTKRRMEVYEILLSHGPMTANEIVRKSKGQYPDTNPSSFAARLSELKRFGAVIEIGSKPDSVSGHSCYVWDLTDHLPVSDKETKTTKEVKIEKALAALRELYYDRDNNEQWTKVASLIEAF